MIDVFIAGAQKSATTSLLTYLGQHPSVLSQPQMEMSYFHIDKEYHLGSTHLEDYYQLPTNGNKMNVAKHATFSRSEKALQRLKEHNPECKIIFCTREPVQRAFSSYLMEKRNGSITCSFDELINIAFHEKENHWYYNVIIELGCYDIHLNRILNYFPRNQMKVIRMEDLKNNPDSTVRALFQWLKINEEEKIHSDKKHNTKNDISVVPVRKFFHKYPVIKQIISSILSYKIRMYLAKMVSRITSTQKNTIESISDYPDAQTSLLDFYKINNERLKKWGVYY
ncbi:MAG: sulfotransferase [Cytophagales bacterium]|nr:sulfotransferase [Cytophagales bacterium]